MTTKQHGFFMTSGFGTMLAGAYSNRFRRLQEQQISNLKILSAAVNGNTARDKNGKPRQFSLETNKRRKLQEMRQKMVALEEEKRCQEILQQRRQTQQEATERFQRAPLQNNKNRIRTTTLEDLLRIVRGGETSVNNPATVTRQQRASSAKIFPKERDKRDSHMLHVTNKLLTKRPSSQPGRPVSNGYLYDQSLRNFINSRNLFEQQLRNKQNQQKTNEQVATPVARDDNDDTDSDNNDFCSIDSLEEKRQRPRECNSSGESSEENQQKETETLHSESNVEPKRIDCRSNFSEKEGTAEQPHLASGVYDQQVPCAAQKSPTTMEDGKNSLKPLQASFRKTAWIQPSMTPNNGCDPFQTQIPFQVSQSKVEPHSDVSYLNSSQLIDVNKDQSSNQQQQPLPDRTLLRGKPPICGAPVKQTTIFQPKHNVYDRHLCTPFYPVTSGHLQQRPIWITEREPRSQLFLNSSPIEPPLNEIKPQLNPNNADDTVAASHLKNNNNNNLPVTEKYGQEFTKGEENKLQPSDDFVKLDDKSTNNNNVKTPIQIVDNEVPKTKQIQPRNFQFLVKSDRKTVPRKLFAGQQKAIRGILKVTSTDNGKQRPDIRDSLEITRQLFNHNLREAHHLNSRETTQEKMQSKPRKKHVRFAPEDEFSEMDDEELTVAASDEVVLNKREETVENLSLVGNRNNHNSNHIQQWHNDGNCDQEINNKDSNKKEVFGKKELHPKSQINWLWPDGKQPQVKAHIIKQTGQELEECDKYQIPDPTIPNSAWSDKKNVNEKSLCKNSNIQYITMRTLKKLVASNKQGVSNARKESRTASTMSKEQSSFGFAVDQTPTDEEINWLWEKVQSCLQQKPTIIKSIAQTVSETKSVLSHMYLDGRILDKTNTLCVNKMASPSLWYPLTSNGMLMLDGKATSNYAKRLTFLQQRAGSFTQGPMTENPENVSSSKFEPETLPSSTVRDRCLDISSKAVTNSLADFLNAEELSETAKVGESQTVVAIKEVEMEPPKQDGVPSKHRGGAPPSCSFLSLEERRLMESLERINNKLKSCTNPTAPNDTLTHPLKDQLQRMEGSSMGHQEAQSNSETQNASRAQFNGII